VEINELLQYIEFTEWVKPIEYKYPVSHAYLMLWAIAKNGKKYHTMIGGSLVMQGRKSKRKLETLKESSVLSIEDLLEQGLKERIGIKGHRGYFKIQRFEPIRR